MEAQKINLLEFLSEPRQFIVPIYQRTYSWEESYCQQLWKDILNAGEDDKILAHFIGSVVYVEGSKAIQNPWLVIDGQQRLTTIILLLEALSRSVGDDEPIEGFSAEKLRKYLLNPSREKEEEKYKLLLTQTDKDSLLALLKQKEWPEQFSIRLQENFNFFIEQIKKLGGNLEKLCKGMKKITMVCIVLKRDQDNPQLIFERMNSTGKKLSQSDLIRNFVLMGLEPPLQTRLYEEYWRPMEIKFGQQYYNLEFDGFMRHYLTVKTGEIPRIDDVYEKFNELYKGKDIEPIVEDIRKFSGYFCAMKLDKEQNKDLLRAFRNLRELKADVAFPLLLKLYHNYDQSILTAKEFVESVHLIESYVFRRAVCEIPTNSMNRTFAAFPKLLKEDRCLESMQAHFLNLKSYRKFPSDKEFEEKIQERNLYNFRSRIYWLRRMENYNRKEPINVKDYTIEHVLPQNEKLPIEWQKALGKDWKQIQEEWLHKLGNLTLTGYNSKLSDKPFNEKRDNEEYGFKYSPLKLNKDLGQEEKWNEQTIQRRGERLASKAVEVWHCPHLDDDILESYREKTTQKRPEYKLEDHEHLIEGSPMRSIFDELRNKLLHALDEENISEEVLKYYIAYKETDMNFVKVKPQKNQLRLAIKISLDELEDSRKMAKSRDSEVRVILNKKEDLPYVFDLIRQAFEFQVGDK